MTEILYQEPLAHYEKRKNMELLKQPMFLLMFFAVLLGMITVSGPVLVFLALYIIVNITSLTGCIFIAKYHKRVTLTSEGFVAAVMGPWDPEQLSYSEITYIKWAPNWPITLQIHMRTRWPRTIEMPLEDLDKVVWILRSKGLEFRQTAVYYYS